MADNDEVKTEDAPPPPEPESAPPPVSEPEPISEPDPGKLKDAQDDLNKKAGEKEGLPVNKDGDLDKSAQTRDNRSLIKERADMIREERKAQEKAADDEEERRDKQEKQQEKVQKEQKQAAAAQRGTAEQNELVEVKQGAFGEAKGFMPKYKADADGYTYSKIKPKSRLTKWTHRN